MEENSLNETVRDSVNVQLDELGNDLKDFVTDTTRQIDKHIEKKFAELSEATKDLVESVRSAVTELPLPTRAENSDTPSPNYKHISKTRFFP